MSNNASNKQRFFYVDNIRIYLTVLVILHHVAVAYGGSGGWPLKEPATDAISPIILLLFNALNQSYFMSFFFVLAGYFTPKSLERKGSRAFLQGRLVRLGIPMLFYSFILGPTTSWIVAHYAYNVDISLFEALSRVFTLNTLLNFGFGHLWFLEALLIFAILYVAYKKTSEKTLILYENSFPPDRAIAISIGVFTIITFLVRTIIPIGEYIFSLQFAHMTHYIFSFFIGVLAYRGDWFKNLSASKAGLWGKVALVNIILLPIIFVIGAGGGVEAFMGGVTWQSFANSAWESVCMVSIIIWMLHFFQNRFNYQGRLLGNITPTVFATYIFHQITVVIIMIPMLGFAWHSFLKFIVVSIISVPACFLVSSIIMKIPYTDRIL